MNGPVRDHSSLRNGRALTGATAILVYLALVKVLLHLLTAGNYGYFRDELYYVAAGGHLDLGYVDFPPFVALVARLTLALFGESLVALHFFPALAGALVVVLAGLMARELGGGRFAQGLAALATLIAPNMLVFGTWLSMDAFDQLFWVAGAYVLLLILKRDNPKLWPLFGVIAGLGLLTKLTMLYFGLAVFLALLITPARRQLLGPWPWLGGALALAFLLPYVVWEIMHGWPTLEFWANYGAKIDPSSPFEFLVEQIVTMQPPTFPLWILGLYYYLFARDGRPVRALGWIYIILFVLFLVQNARFYFLAPAYPMLYAAGATVAERVLTRRHWNWAKPAYAVVLVISGIIVAPLTVVPALPVDMLARITGAAGGDGGVQIETRQVAKLPQNFADRFGWKNMTATVAGVYDGLPEDKRAKACILTGNYGEAGAIDFFGPRYGLPPAISGHNSYYIWGPGDCTGDVVVSIGVPRDILNEEFGKIQQRAMVKCEYCMPDENGLPVYANQEPELPLKKAWPMFRHFD
jgi:4-amino-4-deoxy-L-arabinose transferase-like glycosyltransferase